MGSSACTICTEFLGIVFIDLDIEYINIGEDLEQYPLAFHNGFTGFGADIAESE